MTDTNQTPESSFDVPALIEFMQTQMGINPFTVYCQLTGKPIGRLSPDELEPFLAGDIEAVADNLFVRIIASMRPSIHWNVMREDSLMVLAKSRPVETLAYLLNRLFQPTDSHKLPITARLEDQHQRIKLYQFLLDLPADDRESLYSTLIELDAKMNLSTLTIDLTAAQFMASFADSLPILDDFYERSIRRWYRSQKNEEDSRRWFKGNTMARPAFFQAFMEAKPESKQRAKVRAKRERNAELDSLWDAVMEQVSVEPLSTVTPVVSETSKSHAGKVPSFLIRSK